MSEIDLRWRLRQLPRDIDPPRDLWPDIAEGIAPRPASVHRRWPMNVAMAASLLLTAGLLWKTLPLSMPSATPLASNDPTAQIVTREAQAITDEYQAALRQFDGAPIADQANPGLQVLDRSVLQIRQAIAADPDSVFLLQQLRKTCSRRLALTQRAIVG